MATDSSTAARVLMGDSLGFHIIFALLGVGLPLMVSLLEWWSIRKNNEQLRVMAHKLSIAMTVLVVAGVVSGTIIAIQMSLMWGELVRFGGPVIGLPFALEGYAFMLEAVFLAFYMATWKRLRGYRHWVLSLPVIAGAFLSAFFITTVNAWMNQPAGFELVDGQMTNISIFKAMFTTTAFFKVTHSVLAYYAATALVVVGCYAWAIRKRRIQGPALKTTQWVMARLSILALVCIGGIIITGHFQTQHLAKTQPRKFAAIELVPHSRTHAPYVIGGTLSADGQRVEGGLRIPNLLSILAGNRPSTPVPGLNDFPRADWPLLIVNKIFEAKMALMSLMVMIPVAFVILYARWRQKAFAKPVLWALTLSGPLAIVVIELGWMVTELGRQPFAVNGYLRTRDAFTGGPNVTQWGYVFPIMFVVLFVVTAFALRFALNAFDKREQKT